MVTDILRHGKRKWVWYDAERTLGGYIRWFKAPPGAKVLPVPHNFGSETWDPVHWFNPGIGEDDNSGYTWDNGALLHPYKGLRFCGKPEWWLNGCPSNTPPLTYNSTGMPTCCGRRGAYDDAYSESWDVFRGL
jgi:hypothetical protein